MVALPSDSVRSCVNVYGRWGRRRRVACRRWWWLIVIGRIGRGEVVGWRGEVLVVVGGGAGIDLVGSRNGMVRGVDEADVGG